MNEQKENLTDMQILICLSIQHIFWYYEKFNALLPHEN